MEKIHKFNIGKYEIELHLDNANDYYKDFYINISDEESHIYLKLIEQGDRSHMYAEVAGLAYVTSAKNESIRDTFKRVADYEVVIALQDLYNITILENGYVYANKYYQDIDDLVEQLSIDKEEY